MKRLNHAHIVLLVLCILSLNQLWGQEKFATIRKNVNVLAKSLNHDLNPEGNTLLLSSEEPILKVYTVGDFSGLVDLEVNGYEKSISLNSFRKGKYVFVVDQPKMKIVFQVIVNRNGPEYKAVRRVVASSTRPRPKPKAAIKVSRTASVTVNKTTADSRAVAAIASDELLKKKPGPKKEYNLTDLERAEMQTREEARKLQAARNAKMKSQYTKSGSGKLYHRPYQ